MAVSAEDVNERESSNANSLHTNSLRHIFIGLEEKWDALSVLAKVKGSPADELKLLQGFYRWYLNAGGAEVCLKAQRFLSASGSNQNVSKVRVFLFRTLFHFAGGEDTFRMLRGRTWIGWCERRGCWGQGTDLGWWLAVAKPGGSGPKEKRRKRMVLFIALEICEASNRSRRKHPPLVPASVSLDDSECERIITEPLPHQLPVSWTGRKRWMSA